ncbi:MAG: hypothetical protein WDO13_06700 [Verrucomicrobiota bacterium]
MKTPLRILHLEDDPNEVDLVHHTLQSQGIVCEILYAQDEAGFVHTLETAAST